MSAIRPTGNGTAARTVFGHLVGTLRSSWRRGRRISAAVERDFARLPLVHDGWPIRR